MTKTKLIIIISAFGLLGAACTPGSVSTTLRDGGAWFSSDKGENWEQKVLIYSDRTVSKTIADTDVKKIFFSSEDTRKIFAVTYKNGLWLSWNSGKNWDQIFASPDVLDAVVHPEESNVLYVASGPNVVKSEDEGSNWKAVYTSDSKNDFITSITVKPTNPAIVYASSSLGKLLISENNGVSWREIAANGDKIVKMQFHPASPNLLYAGFEKKGLASSTDAGASWGFYSELDEDFSNYPGSREFRDFEFLPTGIIYASKFGLLRSLNQTRDWTALPLVSGKNDANILTITVNPENPLEIYYGTRNTFYYSLDGGFNWIPRRLPTARGATDIVINPNNVDEIYMGVTRFR